MRYPDVSIGAPNPRVPLLVFAIVLSSGQCPPVVCSSSFRWLAWLVDIQHRMSGRPARRVYSCSVRHGYCSLSLFYHNTNPVFPDFPFLFYPHILGIT